MHIYSNNIFRALLLEYTGSSNYEFNNSNLVKELYDLLRLDKLEETDRIKYGNFFFYKDLTNPELSFEEDFENHFHVDGYVSQDIKEAFILGKDTIFCLAEAFESAGISNIRFCFSFDTPEMSLDFAKRNNSHEDGDEYYISDRLSCFRKRGNEDAIISTETFNNYESAILIIDI